MARYCCPIDIDVGTFEEVIGPDEDEPHYVIFHVASKWPDGEGARRIVGIRCRR